MLSRLYYRFLAPRAVVLMYHRVAVPASDVWEIAVSQQNFEAQLQVLQRMGSVQPLPQLLADLNAGKLKNKSIAISFDDGYADNFETALPLLEQYDLPATFFLTSIQEGPFWWDELEQIFMTAPQLPPSLSLSVGAEVVTFELAEEAVLNQSLQRKHQSWKALTEPPPTRRGELYLKLWEHLKPLKPGQQKQALGLIKEWAGVEAIGKNEMMRPDQLAALRKHPLISIGAHTVHHPALGFQEAATQEAEIGKNKKLLEQFFNYEIDLLAYPFGNYNHESMKVAADLRFKAAFTTEPGYITQRSPRYQLGRCQVNDWNKAFFQKQLSGWFRNN